MSSNPSQEWASRNFVGSQPSELEAAVAAVSSKFERISIPSYETQASARFNCHWLGAWPAKRSLS